MTDSLQQSLHQYLVQNHLDLLISLQQENRLNTYLKEKIATVRDMLGELADEHRPTYVVEALCMEELTRDLRPSRFEYIRKVLREEFEEDYVRMSQSGILTYEVINLVGACEPIFEVFQFSEDNEDDKELAYAVVGMIAEYVEGQVNTA